MNGILEATASGSNLLNPPPSGPKMSGSLHTPAADPPFMEILVLDTQRSRKLDFCRVSAICAQFSERRCRVFLVKVGYFYVMSTLQLSLVFMLESSAKIGNLEASRALGMIEMGHVTFT